MEIYIIFIKTLMLFLGIVTVGCVTSIIYSIWWKPRSLEKHLRKQRIRGTSYKVLNGDMKEILRFASEAHSKPITLTQNIVPRVSPFFHSMVQKYGKVSLSWYETKPRLIVADSQLMKLVLADKNGHFGRPPLNPFVDLLQLGISTLEGKKWAKRRKLITPAFHFEKLKGMVPAFSTSCIDLINRWKSLVSSKGSFELNVAQEFQYLTGDVISRTAFGSSNEEGKRIFALQKQQAVLVLEAYSSIYIPGFRFIPTKKNRKRYKIDGEIKGMLRNMISKKEQAMQKGEFGSNDLLSLLLQYRDQADNGLTTEDVIEECKLFYFAGQETTANWLTWTMVLLAIHPNWQEKARQEVLQIFGKKTPDVDNMNRLKIVTMILQEVLRLFPPVTSIFRYTCKTTNIGGMSIPAGVEIFLFTLMLHYDPEYWGDDVNEFKPERFANGVAKAAKDDEIAFYPFGWGPRNCLGQNFSMIEAKMALTMILQHFSFELSPTYTHAPYNFITLQPQYGAPLIIHQL